MRCFKFKNVNQMHANCMNLPPTALFCLTAALSAVYWGFGVILSPAVTHNDDRAACSDKVDATSGWWSADWSVLPDVASFQPHEVSYIGFVRWAGTGYEERQLFEPHPKTSFLLHSPACSSVKLFLVQYCPHMDLTGKTSKFVDVPLHWWGLLMRIFEEKFEAI